MLLPKWIFLSFIQFGISCSIIAQSPMNKLDSMKAELENFDKEDSLYIHTNLVISETLLKTDVEESIRYAEQAVAGAIVLGDEASEGLGLRLIGLATYSQGNYKSSLNYFMKSLLIFEGLEDLKRIARLNSNIAVVFTILGDREKAVKSYEESYRVASRIGDNEGMIVYGTNIGIFHSESGNDVEALEYYKNALTLARESKDKDKEALIIYNMALSHKAMKSDSSIFYLLESARLAKESGDSTSLHYYFLRLAEGYFEFDEFEKSMKYADKIEEEYVLGWELAMLQRLKSNIYERKGDYATSLKYLKLHKVLYDSINDIKRVREVTEIQEKFENDKKEAELEKKEIELAYKEATIHNQNIILGLAGALLLSVVVYIYNNYRNSKRRKEAFRLLSMQNEEIIKAEQFRSKVLSIVGHDIKSPLASIKTTLTMITQGYLSEKEKEHLFMKLMERTNSADQLLKNVFEWAQSQMKDLRPENQSFDLKKHIDQVFAEIVTVASAKNIRLINEVSQGMELVSDHYILHIILRNMLMNAIKFSFEKGEVMIRAINMNNRLEIQVIDQGVGMDDEEKAKLFTFKKSPVMGTKEELGSGIGLLLCNHLSKKIDARLGVESKMGEGSTFKISFGQPVTNQKSEFSGSSYPNITL